MKLRHIFLGGTFVVLNSATAISQGGELGEIVVTGSQIKNSAYPMVDLSSIGNELITASAGLSIDQLLNELPNSKTLNSLNTDGFSPVGAGISTLNLRNFGVSRNVVLLNGKRFAGGDIFNPGAVDLNSIPSVLIKRVDLFTGAATATYGSGAIAGGVNILLKDNLDGLYVESNYGESEQGDGEEIQHSITIAKDFSDQNAKFLLNYTRAESKSIFASDREFSAYPNDYANRKDLSSSTPQGLIVGYTENSSRGVPLVPNDSGEWTDIYNSESNGFNQANYRLLQLPLTRNQITLMTEMEVLGGAKINFDVWYSDNNTFTQQEPIRDQNGGRLPSSYPFFPEEVLATWEVAGEPVPDEIRYFHRLQELGPRKSEQDRTTFQWNLGLEKSWGNWQLEARYLKADSEFYQLATGHYNKLHFDFGTNLEENPNAAGEYRCANETARIALGCMPIDVFSADGISEQAVEFISAEGTIRSSIASDEALIKLSGPLRVFGGQFINSAFGVNFRKEALNTNIDSLTASGQSTVIGTVPTNGSDQVKEIFSEFNLPIELLGKPNFINVGAAYRLSNYKSVGTTYSWNSVLQVEPARVLKISLRAGRAIRAPHVKERFSPSEGGYSSIDDPCLGVGDSEDENLKQNCVQSGVPESVVLGEYNQVVLIQKGNENLDEEIGRSYTLGLDFSPEFLSGINLNLTVFDLQVENAITLIDSKFKLEHCFRSESFEESQLCEGIVRGDESQNYQITSIQRTARNISSIKTSGVDFSASFDKPLGNFALFSTFSATYTSNWEEEIDGETFVRLNEPGYQRWKGLWQVGIKNNRLYGVLSTRYLGNAIMENNPSNSYVIENNDISSVNYLDAYISYSGENLFGASSYELYLSAKNLNDKQPPYIPDDSLNGTRGSATAAGVYDVRGRYWKVGMKIKF